MKSIAAVSADADRAWTYPVQIPVQETEMSAVMLYVTARDRDEAMAIAGTLVEERLIACGNVLGGMESIYWWNGKLERSHEAVLIAKTDRRNVDLVTARIIELHSYETPCVVAY
jgi:periplasmic divalent cation tolerance protein